LPKPILIKFNTQLIYPAYLNKKNETLSNIGDLQLPQGTKIKWTFFTKNTEIIYLNFIDSIFKSEQTNDDEFSFSKQVMQSVSYSIKTGNDFLKQNPDSINYSLNVIPDQIPAIDVSEKIDSLNTQNIYFSGSIKDDYGFTRLIFKYTLSGKDSLGNGFSKQSEIPIGINKQNSTQPYFYFFNAANFNLQPGDKIEYYFEVWDNDGVNGSKSAKTNIMLFKAPSIDDINKATDKNNSETKKDINDEIKKAKDLQKDITDFSKKLAEKKQMGYEEKKKLEDILKKQNELKNKIEQTKQENQLNNKQQEELTKNDEALLEKQKQLEELFENIMTPEMKKLFDELNKMLDKLDKNQVQEKLEELKLSNKDMEKELDRTLEAFKQMEVEQKMQQAIDKLDDIKNKQDELKKETEGKEETKEKEGTKDAKTDNQKLEEKQKELNKKFDDLKKDIKDLEQKNDALEQKNEIPKTEEKQNEISKDMQQSAEELNKKNKKEAAKSEKEASDGMQEMKEQMQKSMDEMEKEEQEEDMQALRQILENLLNLSFGQEDLMTNLSKLRTENPQYLNVPKKQRKLQDDSKIVEDSLFALSKRNPAISATVNREISSIIMNMKKTVNSLEERQQADAQTRMQYSMTSINNLALLLNESLEQMQQKAKEGKKDGSGKCKKPGKGAKPSSKPGDKPSMQSMKQMQEQLNKQIEELKKALEKGQKPGGEKPGNKPGEKPGGKKPGGQGGMGNQGKEGADGMPGLSQQLAKAAAQQEVLRRQMQQMLDKIKKDGGNNPGGNLAEMMEQTERDIVNRQITQETMKRQQDIITKLLESDKAEREREQDEKRKSNEAKNQNLSNPTQFLEYKRLKEKELELLNTVPPSLTPYYKDKVNNYFNNVNK
jgi:hypothetical protein